MTEPQTLVAIGLLIGSIAVGAVFWRRILNRRRPSQADATEPATFPFFGRRLSPSPSPKNGDVERRIVDPRIYVFVPEYPGRSRQLLAVAAALKYRHAHEPIHLYVVASGVDGRESGIDTIDRTLSRTVQDTATPAPVSTQIIPDHPVPNAIVDQVCEESADVVLTAWEESCQTNDVVSGETVDRLLARMQLPVYAVHTSAEEITVSRLHLALPREIDHYEGFYEALYNVKQIASMHDAGITVYVFEGSVHQYRQLFDLVKIDVSVEFARANGWEDAVRKVEAAAEPADLVIALAVRKEGQGWDGGFPEVSRRLRGGAAQSAAVFFLREDEPGRDDYFLRM